MGEETRLDYEHLEKVLQFYPFELNNITLQSSRSGRTIWEVETNEGVKILKQAHMNPKRMLFVAGAHLHLLNNGLPITKLHKTKRGAFCIGAGEYSYVLYDKHQGKEIIYYSKEQLEKVLIYAGQFQRASEGYISEPESKIRSRLGKWHKLYRWKLQELEGNKKIALSFQNDPFSVMFLEYADKMLARGKKALQEIDEPYYSQWTKEVIASKGFCQQDFTLARFTEMEDTVFMKELHSITNDLPVRDLRIILNKVMKKMSVWDTDFAVHMLKAYDSENPLSQEQYRILWTELSFPHSFCAIAHKYYLAQKRSWSDEKYIWALQNIIALEESKEEFLQNFSDVFHAIKSGNGGE
ncbi:spore coat putative kinase CotS [Bacillus sp. TL12]|uniref:spore coat putative kinase CotS n=1 Tax=Bacillus sp. TL12 TaxID=2894756 RepID=UPI001F51DC56|nr:CotS family spore coat protein [Bacillus sp. TL12]MCI0765551.1 CotS family spore coat protein [Bacillus sp. TL12]